MELRFYQADLRADIHEAWARTKSVLATLPTGGGKTVIFSSIIAEEKAPSVAIAHRGEILIQIAISLGRCGVPHRILGPDKLVRNVMKLERLVLGKSYVDQQATCAVAGVDTLQARAKAGKSPTWFKAVKLVVQDEAHHLQEGNKWGNALKLFPNAKLLGVTATPIRSDGGGLKAGTGGVFEEMVEGPTMGELIALQFLTKYKIYAPKPSIDVTGINLTKGGDYNAKQLSKAAHKSQIVGDVVEHYLRLAPGKRGVTFVTDVGIAHETARRFNAAGVPAKALSAKTPDAERIQATEDLRSGKLLQLVNVDLFGEGFDLPAIEVVSMARPTASYGLFAQQFGRVLRPAPGKELGIVIDHVGNTFRHGLPDTPKDWRFGEANTKVKRDGPPIRICENVHCMQPWEGYSTTCPHCGYVRPIVDRSSPAAVEGDLIELTAEVLAAMRRDVAKIDRDPEEIKEAMLARGTRKEIVYGNVAQHKKRQAAQVSLRQTMSLWGGAVKAKGIVGRDRERAFFHTFGADVLSAQALGRADAEKLEQKIRQTLINI